MNKLNLMCIVALVIGSLAALVPATPATDSTEAAPTTSNDTKQEPVTDGNNITHNVTTDESPNSNKTEPVTTAAPPVKKDKDKVADILQVLKDSQCNGTDDKPCNIPNITGDDYTSLCKVLDDAADCIKSCDVKSISNEVTDERKKMNCDGCGFLQGSLLMLLLAAFLHLLV